MDLIVVVLPAPVSYTHLDVYKRQASIHWSGFIPVKKAWNCWTVSRRNTLPAYKPHDAQTGAEGMRADIRPVSYTHLSYTVTAKSNVGALSEDIAKTPYKALVNPSTNSFALLNAVLFMREIAVSYTHLDVYKRQLRKVRNKAVHENYSSVEEGKVLLQMAHSLCEWFMQTYGAVSYTHLDVYKRQQRYQACYRGYPAKSPGSSERQLQLLQRL